MNVLELLPLYRLAQQAVNERKERIRKEIMDLKRDEDGNLPQIVVGETVEERREFNDSMWIQGAGLPNTIQLPKDTEIALVETFNKVADAIDKFGEAIKVEPEPKKKPMREFL